MKHVLEVCLIAVVLVCVTDAQDPTKPMLRPGIHVEMPAASHAVEMRAADKEDATVISVTADGKIFLGLHPAEVGALKGLDVGTVYVKADARAPFQRVLSVLEALQGQPVVLLTAPTENAPKKDIMPPYGLTVTVSGR
jgi:biopolymer transport protein ExbD